MGNPKTNQFVSPYLGTTYNKEVVQKAIEVAGDKIVVKNNVDMESCVDLLVDDKIIAIFQKGSESGRRALGNRSILANPINPKMKDLINEKVKHRQWYRPFAPSILEQHGGDWFEGFFSLYVICF